MKKILLAVFFALPVTTFAGGPLVIEGADGNTPVNYPNPNVALNFDPGMLGSRTNAEADALVQQGFNLWNAVTTATINLVQGAGLSADIDVTNYQNLLPTGAPGDPSVGDGLNPLIYDSDGQIIDDIFNANASDNIAGFAASIFFLNTPSFIESFAVLNGKLNPPDSEIINTVAHEIGHLIGIDHSQLDIDNTEDPSNPAIGCTAASQAYPIMYPFLCRKISSLHTDDVAAVAALYPGPNVTIVYGQITGFFVNGAGNPVLGANLWVKNTATGETYSVVSDYLLQNTGFFSILLPAGTYTLHANSINPLFFDASSVGPYATSLADKSFLSPITAVNFEEKTPGSTKSLPITTGKATDVRFVTDGSGSFTTDNNLFFARPPAVGGGTISPLVFVLLLAGFWLRKSGSGLAGFCCSYRLTSTVSSLLFSAVETNFIKSSNNKGRLI